MITKIKAEWGRLRKVAVHKPGIEMFFGLLDPYASLYERAFSQNDALKEHEQLTYTLKQEFKVDVISLKDTIINLSNKKTTNKNKLIDLAEKSVTFKGDEQEIKLAHQEMDSNRRLLDCEHYFNTIILNPCIELESRRSTRMIHLHVTEREPLSNIYFMRDQQIVTDQGMVLSRMSKPQRRREPILTRFLWEMLQETLIHEIKRPGTFEGGDFIPADEFALIGIGDRTNKSGVEQMLEHGVGFDEVAVVHQPNHPLIPRDKDDPMMNMHLDNYFNIISKEVALGSRWLLKTTDVDIYHHSSDGYDKSADQINLYDYIRDKGFEIIDINTLEQMSYAANLLCIKNGTVLTVEVERMIKETIDKLRYKAKSDPERYGKLLTQVRKDFRHLKDEGQFFPHKKEIYQHDIEAYPLNFTNLTGGYGGPHCMTCALRRT